MRAGREGGDRTRWLEGIIDSMDMNLSKLHKIVKDREGWHAVVHEVAKNWTSLTNTSTFKHLVKKNSMTDFS